MTTIVPEQRTAVGRHRRGLEVILASAPAGAAVVVACTVPTATSGPPLHVHAASDETFFVLSGVLVVHADGQVATIPEGGLVHVSRGMPHTFATTPDSPARFLVMHTPGGSGEFHIAAAHAVREHGGPLPRDDVIRLARGSGRQAADRGSGSAGRRPAASRHPSPTSNTVAGQRREVIDALETQRADDGVDGWLILLDHDGDQAQMHRDSIGQGDHDPG